MQGNIDQLQLALHKFLQSTLSFRIMHEEEEAIELKESHYHFLMIGLFNDIMSGYDVTHEIESGKGYVDTMIIPRALFCKSTQAIILEYKYAQEEKALQKEAKKGLEAVYDLSRQILKKAITTICKLVLICLSQFFHNLLHFSNQLKLLSITHRLGNTLNLPTSFLLITSTLADGNISVT